MYQPILFQTDTAEDLIVQPVANDEERDPYDGVPLGVECAWPVELLS